MPPQPPDLSPEACYDQAVQHLGAGRVDVAIKLLQIAALKAPHDGRYREALREARQLRAEQVQSVEPEVLYLEARAILDAGGDTEQAIRLLKLARARAPGEARYREALEQLQPPRPASPPPPSPPPPSRESASEAAIADAEAAADRPPAAPARPAGSRRPVLAGLLALLLISGGLTGVSIWLQGRGAVPVEPYRALLPAVVNAEVVGQISREELVLTVPARDWEATPAASREPLARALHARAQQEGFRVVYLYTPTPGRRLLATAHPERVYLPE